MSASSEPTAGLVRNTHDGGLGQLLEDLGPHLDDLPPSLRLPQESGVQTTVSGWNWLQANQYAW